MADFYINLGLCLRLKGRLKEAQDCDSHVIAIRQDYVPSHNHPSADLQAGGKVEEDVTAYKNT
jgi:hypothetical protein